MNKISLILLSLFVGLACNKDDGPPAPIINQLKSISYTGSLHAMMNDSLWSARCQGVYDSTLFFAGETFTDSIHVQNALVFDRLRKAMGVQPIRARDYSKPQPFDSDSTAAFHTTDVYGNPDITGDNYDVLNAESLNNFVHITGWSDDDSKITGTFSVTLVRTYRGRDSQYPDTIRFRNGSFTLAASNKQ
jgi:hypothetical protein